jgi:predicted regulator of Ras-like GTPase activity (Roadblock/LC7/MglB family)
MLEPILQGLREVEGVQGAMVVDHTAAVIAHRAHAVYDLPVLQQVARSVVNSIDSVQLIQDDWDMLTAHFGEGKLLLRSLRTTATAARSRRYVLAVIADATLNVAFLGVALRVAAAKLVAELESAPVGIPVGSVPGTLASGSTGRVQTVQTIDAPRPELAKTGLSWSGVSSGSGVGSSDVGVADTASSTFLSACTKALAASVGPMAKVFVKEAVRKVCGERPFSRGDGPAVLAQLATTIEDTDDRATFQRATRAL